MRWEMNLYIEVKDGDRWVLLSKPIPSLKEEDFYLSCYFRGGTMPLFAVLGHEEAGEKTGIKQVFHSLRGMPADLSPEIKKADKQQKGKTYFHSWFLLQEWMAFEWREEGNTEIVGKAEFEQKMNDLLEWGDPEEIRVIYWFIKHLE